MLSYELVLHCLKGSFSTVSILQRPHGLSFCLGHLPTISAQKVQTSKQNEAPGAKLTEYAHWIS